MTLSAKSTVLRTDLSAKTLEKTKSTLQAFVFDVFGLTDETSGASDNGNLTEGLMGLILDLRKQARDNKDWPMADKIRDTLQSLNVSVKDGKSGTEWSLN